MPLSTKIQLHHAGRDMNSLFIYLWVLTFPLEDCSEFGNFVITHIIFGLLVGFHNSTYSSWCTIGSLYDTSIMNELLLKSGGFLEMW